MLSSIIKATVTNQYLVLHFNPLTQYVTAASLDGQ